MNKFLNKSTFKLVLLLFFIISVSAQSDTDKWTNFKNTVKKIAEKIDKANKSNEFEDITKEIEKLKTTYSSDKDLIDKAIYPESYNSSIEKLVAALKLRNVDLTQIETLATEVTTLATEVSTLKGAISVLNNENSTLINKIKSLNLIVATDKRAIDSLKIAVKNLKNALRKRDQLVKDIVDSLIIDFANKPYSLNDTEKQALSTQLQSKNIFYNVERTIKDNIEYLNALVLEDEGYEDIVGIKTQHKDFQKYWSRVGKKIAETFLNNKEQADQLSYITSLFNEWNSRINSKIWLAVKALYVKNKVGVEDFYNAETFTASNTNFITNEINSAKIKDRDAVVKTYDLYTDDVWFSEFKVKWYPILLENKLITDAQKDEIEAKIKGWKILVDEGESNFLLYLFVGISIVLFLIIVLNKYGVFGKKKINSI